jgi:hypothetical protein
MEWGNGSMIVLGTSLMVGGMAFLFSGLIFLLPVPSKGECATKPVTIDQDQERIEYHLQRLQDRRGRRAQ